MSAIRDRSVVRSSVIPSAKYCRSGSLLRLANGSTTIDKRGATRGCAMEVAAATAAGGVEEDLVAGQNHQVTTAITSTVATAAPIGARMLRRRRVGTAIGTLVVGRPTTPSGRQA